MKHLDLFSGIGGFALACYWAGIETIGFVEIDKFCQKVLRRHWPRIPIVEDIRDVERIKEIVAYAQSGGYTARLQPEAVDSRGRCDGRDREQGVEAIKEIVANAAGKGLPDRRRASMAVSGGAQPESERCGSESDRLQEPSGQYGDNGTSPEPALLITAGFPCQPFSVAGKRGGDTDDRYLWPETLAVIKAVKPAWVLLENVAGIIPMALDTVLSDLERAGYAWEAVIVPACAVNAPHRRDRIWIVAYSRIPEPRRVSNIKWQEGIAIGGGSQDAADTPREGLSQRNGEGDAAARPCRAEPECGGEDAADTQRTGLEGADTEGDSCPAGQPMQSDPDAERDGIQGWQPVGYEANSRDWWATEPDMGRVAHGVPNRVDRLKCLGNAIVPQVAYEIIRVIKEIERA